MKPLISVVVPVWNRPKLVALCLDSVLAQTYREFELIVIDDGSTDATPEILQQYASKDSRVRVVRIEHAGTSGAFNAGVAQVHGDVFCLLGSDDLWLPTKLEKQVQQSEKTPGHVIHTESLRIDVDGNPQKDVYRSSLLRELGDTGPEAFRERCKHPWACFFGSSIYVPRAALEQAGPFPDSVCQDYHWVIRAALLFDVQFTLVPEHLIMNRTNPQGTTVLRSEFIRKEAEDVRKATLDEAARRGLL